MLPIDELISALEYWKDNAQTLAESPNLNRDSRSFNEGKVASFRLAIDHIRKTAERDYRLGQYYENRKEYV